MSIELYDVVLGVDPTDEDKKLIDRKLRESKVLRDVLTYLRDLGFDVKFQKEIHKRMVYSVQYGFLDAFTYSFIALGRGDTKTILFSCYETLCEVRIYNPKRRYAKLRVIERINLESKEQAINQIEEILNKLGIRTRKFRSWLNEYVEYLQTDGYEADEYELFDIKL
jgi:hypothetical protein